MKTRFRPFPPVFCQFGAPMGRQSANLAINYEDDTAADLAVAGPAYEYDAGGAYWGLSANEGPVWAVWRKGKAHEGVLYIRARGRNHAKSLALDAPE